jgi:hypothetical protein
VIIDTDKLNYETALAAIRTLEKRREELYKPFMVEQRRKAAIRRQQREENNKKLEAKALEDFETLIPGDIVKVTGVRDSRYPYREVTSVEGPRGSWDDGQFSGWQIRQLRDGSFQRGSQHTTHMANKIRGIVHRAQLELTK